MYARKVWLRSSADRVGCRRGPHPIGTTNDTEERHNDMTRPTRPNRPDELAWIQRIGAWGLRVMAIVLLLALTFTMVNVQQFSAHNDPTSWWWWAISWLLDPMASITMAAAIVFEGFLADYGRKAGWLTATKWYAGIAVWAMNAWDPLVHGVPSGVLLHSVAPGIVVGLAEAAPRVRRHIADILSEIDGAPV